MIGIVIICLVVIYFIGKYISATNKDKNNSNTAQFGDGLAGFAKNTGCIVISVIIIVIIIVAIIIFNFLFGWYTTQ